MSDPNSRGLTRHIALLEMALSPLGLYIFLVSPVLNGLIRSLVLRSRDFAADANGAVLTGNAEAMAYALAKIGGVVTVLGKSTVSGLPSHTSLTLRIERLMAANRNYQYAGMQRAIAKGKQYTKDRPGMSRDDGGLTGLHDPLDLINQGKVSGRVFQLASAEPVAVFDTDAAGSPVRALVQPGALLVAFDNPGKMCQVNTAAGVFGYIQRDVKLKAVDGVLPQEIYEAKAREAVEEQLRRQQTSPPAPLLGGLGLTSRQVYIAVGFSVVIFASTTGLLWMFARH